MGGGSQSIAADIPLRSLINYIYIQAAEQIKQRRDFISNNNEVCCHIVGGCRYKFVTDAVVELCPEGL